MPTSFLCRACGSQQRLTTSIATERMFGSGGSFPYGECAHCGSLVIENVPDDLERHYPSGYYSFQKQVSGIPLSSVERRFLHWLTGELGIQRRLARLFRIAGIKPSSRILDIGSGSGTWLQQLRKDGYENLAGLDPYLPVPSQTLNGVTIRCGSIHHAEDNQDLITYHHVLEHVADPREEIAAAAQRLKPGGHLLIRVPVADCWARRAFQTHWIQWDAPRHLWLPTRAALHGLARENKLHVRACWEDSHSIQVWGSRRYRADLIGLSGKYSVFNRRRGLLFALPGLLGATAWSAWLNFRKQGDQVAVLWQKPAA